MRVLFAIMGLVWVAPSVAASAVEEQNGYRIVTSKSAIPPAVLGALTDLCKPCAFGISEAERMVFKELALSAGARRAKVWVGHALSDAEALLRANST
jgi:hypothetical protein